MDSSLLCCSFIQMAENKPSLSNSPCQSCHHELPFIVAEHTEIKRLCLCIHAAQVNGIGMYLFYCSSLQPNVATLLPLFEKFMDEAPDSSSYDTVRQSVIILMGSLARHLEKEDPKVKPIVGKLIEALSTPSQAVSYRSNGALQESCD